MAARQRKLGGQYLRISIFDPHSGQQFGIDALISPKFWTMTDEERRFMYLDPAITQLKHEKEFRDGQSDRRTVR